MINYVTKRDGRKEQFSADKLHRWIEMTAKEDVNWSDLAFRAYRKLNDGCSSVDLHNALVMACLDIGTEASLRVAGKFFVSGMYKEVYGGIEKIPHLKEFGVKCWAKMDYSDEEWDDLNDFISHKADLTYSYTTIRQMADKYLIKDRITGELKETPQMAFMGMAMAAMECMGKDRRVEDVKKLYTYLKDLKINLPSPMLSNLRTPSKGYASCLTFMTDDTVSSLATGEHIAFMMTAASAGIGGYIQSRSIGDSVKGGAVRHIGKIPLYRQIESAVNAMRQQSRGGAATVHFTCLDPEVGDLTQLKNPMTLQEKSVRGIDYSMIYNNSFAKAVATNGKWLLISIKDAPDLYEALFSNDGERFDVLLEKYWNKGKRVMARDIALNYLTQSLETGRMYMYNAQEGNTHTPYKETIYTSNLCVAPETKILTKTGYNLIGELEGQSVEVWNGSEWSVVDVKKTGTNQKLIKVTTKHGYELECTPYHKFYVVSGYGKESVEVRAGDLKAGDKLVKFDLPVVYGEKILSKAYTNGFFSGDGCVTDRGDRVYLYSEKVKLKEFIEHSGKWYDDKERSRSHCHVEGLKEKFFVPTAEYSVESRLNWLSGYMDADGCVYRNGDNQQLVATSVEKTFLQDVQLMLQTLGVSSKVVVHSEAGEKLLPKNDGSGEKGLFDCKESYRLIITSYDLYKLLQLGLRFNRLEVVSRRPQRDAKQFVVVESVEDHGRLDDTYCFNEPKRHLGMFNGILTGQCQEIQLPTKPFKDMLDLYNSDAEGLMGLCMLAGIVQGRVSDEEYADVAYYCLLVIDNVINMMNYPFPSLETSAKKYRAAGVGITNLAYLMAKEGKSYTSKEGKELIHYVGERHAYHLIKASLKLAKEFGVCDGMEVSEYKDGWLPIDTYNKNVDSIVANNLTFDWESLRKEIVANGGIRNTVVSAIAPNESSSQLTNTTNSVYAIRQVKIAKSSGNNRNIVIAPESDVLKYDIAWDLSTKDQIETYALLQKWVDQGISGDLFIDRRGGKIIDDRKLLTDFLLQTKLGMKTRYYINSATGDAEKDNDDERGCGSGGCAL